MSTPIRVGIVGLGYWGPQLLRNFATLDPNECVVKYGCDKNPARCQAFARQYPAITFTESFDDLLNDKTLDAVLIATPTSTHYALAKSALESGKHVLVEKPITDDVSKAEELVALAKKKGLILLVDHTFAYTQAVRMIREMRETGALGDLLYVDSTRINLGLIQKDTNVLWDLAVHDLTILGALAPLSEIEEVFACGSAFYGPQIEVGHLHLKYRSGLHAHVHVSWLSPVKIRSTIISGRKSMIIFNDTEPSEKIRIYDKGVDHDSSKADPFFPKYRTGNVVIPSLPLIEALTTEAKHFLACIRGEEKPMTSGEDGMHIVRILTLADRSIAENKPLKVTV